MKHKFMNKENGKIASVIVMHLDDDGHMQLDDYDFVEDLMNDYAAYEPAKPRPLIKDEKVRKAVQAWAEANGVGRATYMENNYRFFADDTEVGSMIEFEKMPENTGLKNEHSYTITELCGEEEE